MGGDRPQMPERVGQRAGTVAVELVLDRVQYFGSVCNGPLEDGVAVLHEKAKSPWCTAIRKRAAGVSLGALVREHEHGIADLDLGVSDFSVRPRETHDFEGAEGLPIELDGAGAVMHDQERRHRMMTGRDGSNFRIHKWGDFNAEQPRRP